MGIGRELADGEPVPGGDELGHRAAVVGIEVVPDDDKRAAELLVRGVREAGVVRFGEALARVFAGVAAGVHAVDQPGPAARLDGDQRGHETRLLLPPVTRTTGV